MRTFLTALMMLCCIIPIANATTQPSEVLKLEDFSNEPTILREYAVTRIKRGDFIYQYDSRIKDQPLGTWYEALLACKLTHCGLVVKGSDGELCVLESPAIVNEQGIPFCGITPLMDWLARGINGEFIVHRPQKDGKDLKNKEIRKVEAEAMKYVGTMYNFTYQMGGPMVYCSQMYYQAYKDALGVEPFVPVEISTLAITADSIGFFYAFLNGDGTIPMPFPVVDPRTMYDRTLANGNMVEVLRFTTSANLENPTWPIVSTIPFEIEE